jgi:hypothetical protein
MPLMIGAGVAVLLHAAVLPPAMHWVTLGAGSATVAAGEAGEQLAADTPSAEALIHDEPAPPSAAAAAKPPAPQPRAASGTQPPAAPRPAARPAAGMPAPAKAAAAAMGGAARRSRPALPAKPTDMPEIHPGQDHSPQPLAVAWIAYEDYQKMVAPRSVVEQPALQKAANTVPGAPLIPDPNSSMKPGDGAPDLGRKLAGLGIKSAPGAAGDRAVGSAANQAPAPALTRPPDQALSGATAAASAGSAGGPKPASVGTTVLVPGAAKGDLAVLPAVKPADKLPEAPATAGAGDKPGAAGKLVLPALPVSPGYAAAPVQPPPRAEPAATQPTESAAGKAGDAGRPDGPADGGQASAANPAGRRPGEPGARPSGAPRSDSESPPVSLTAMPVNIPMRAGRVVACEGMTIHTVVPRITVGMSFTIPSNPVARLTFNHHGEVVDVKLLRTTGTANWDGPILAALYAWSASGPKLDEITDKAFMDVHILLGDEGN